MWPAKSLHGCYTRNMPQAHRWGLLPGRWISKCTEPEAGMCVLSSSRKARRSEGPRGKVADSRRQKKAQAKDSTWASVLTKYFYSKCAGKPLEGFKSGIIWMDQVSNALFRLLCEAQHWVERKRLTSQLAFNRGEGILDGLVREGEKWFLQYLFWGWLL